jgi:polysaccharide export outer membrane protein
LGVGLFFRAFGNVNKSFQKGLTLERRGWLESAEEHVSRARLATIEVFMRRALIGRVGIVVSSLLLLCLMAISQTVVEPQASATSDGSAQATAKRERIRIGAGDLVEVSIYGVTDFRQETRVNESGDLSLPLIGSVRIGGATVEEAQDVIAKSLVEGGYFRDPHVNVVIKDFASQGVSILGEVTKPGVYPMVGTRRLYDLFSMAGGLTNKAGKVVGISHRDQPGTSERIVMSEDPAKSVENNVEIFPGDTIVVSKAGIVYVVGDVQRPGGFVMENNERMTVLQAVALAQGTNRTAALNSAKILRRTSVGPQEVKIPLKQIMAAKASDMDLQAEDILFIPGSAAKSAFSRGMESVFQVATSVAIYGVR